MAETFSFLFDQSFKMNVVKCMVLKALCMVRNVIHKNDRSTFFIPINF